jgi:hypothetical protein
MRTNCVHAICTGPGLSRFRTSVLYQIPFCHLNLRTFRWNCSSAYFYSFFWSSKALQKSFVLKRCNAITEATFAVALFLTSAFYRKMCRIERLSAETSKGFCADAWPTENWIWTVIKFVIVVFFFVKIILIRNLFNFPHIRIIKFSQIMSRCLWIINRKGKAVPL